MDFEDAAIRLARDQSKMRGRRKGGVAISTKAKQQAEYQRKRQARLRAERENKKRNEAYRLQCLHECQRLFKEKTFVSGSNTKNPSQLFLKPTSIHGDGDKIALPPSVLQTLTSQDFSTEGGMPWTFRIGIVNPNYEFPASPSFQVLNAPTNDEEEMSDDEDEEDVQLQRISQYIDELRHKYIAYTHCTVVEFTQEEGFVGIPRHIAQALIDPENRHEVNRNVAIKTTKTVDPASSNSMNEEPLDITDQTPGHLAWGAFEIPDVELELIMVQLPKGRGCTLKPTEDAIKNNFYGLKDVKLVLEQSLIRTRATLSIGDEVSTWSRGKKFDLKVDKVIPHSFQAITCINTDIEVEFSETKISDDSAPAEASDTKRSSETTSASSDGFRLGTGKSEKDVSQGEGVTPSLADQTHASQVSLLPEPPLSQKDGVCTIQIRYRGGNGKRRFAIETSQLKDLFAFAASLSNQNERSFRLVTRFPRRELTYSDMTLIQAGIQQGQEMLIIEDL